ncbi:hypothetical protein DIC82_12120 [Clostridium beijerinckii]|nr:hypothetical protein DIC82_12120 [Clostridium beijerinckii]
MHKWNKEELLGQNLRIVHSSKESKHIYDIIDTIQNKGGLLAEKIDHVTKEGVEFPALMSAKLVLDSNGTPQFMSATIIDISELKKKDAEINKFNIAMKQSPVAFVITDVNANILYANPVFENITGYTLEEVIGKNTNILKSGETSKELYKELWRTIESGKTWNGKWVNKKKNGENYNEKISITPIFDEYGNVTSYLVVKEDVTELMQSEQNRIAREVAEKANESKTAFLSNMSHEIRTPLNAIIGFAQILRRDGSFSPKQTQQIYMILRSSEHLLKLINSILDLSKIESGKISINNNKFCLHDLLQDLKMMFNVQSQVKNIKFDIVIGEDVPKYILSDEGRIRQLLINILGNSMKFTQKGGITLKVSAKGTKDTNKFFLEFEVRDTGIGIAPGEIKYVFESFHQAQAGVKAGGTGLGLSISKHFVELMGGKISVESHLNKGSIFRVSLPIIRVEKHINEPTESYENVIGIKPGIEPYRVLIADDQVNNRNMLVEVLEPIGFQTREASNGQEAIDVSKKWQPHCILMDIQMPIMDGYEAIKQIKGTKLGQETLVIAVTASVFEEEAEKVMETGADFFLRKPFKLEELYKMIKSIEELVQEKLKEISNSQMATLTAISKLAEYRDEDTGKHIERTQLFCSILAKELRKNPSYNKVITDEFVKNIFYAASLHDVGKIGIPDQILLKKGKLTIDEFEIMKKHVIIGKEALQEVLDKYPKNEFIKLGIELTAFHHEKWNGNGYPDGLSGNNIPISARIMALVDVYDALRSRRSYKEGFSHSKSIEIIKEGAGKHFDPDVLNAFLAIESQFEDIFDQK